MLYELISYVNINPLLRVEVPLLWVPIAFHNEGYNSGKQCVCGEFSFEEQGEECPLRPIKERLWPNSIAYISKCSRNVASRGDVFDIIITLQACDSKAGLFSFVLLRETRDDIFLGQLWNRIVDVLSGLWNTVTIFNCKYL